MLRRNLRNSGRARRSGAAYRSLRPPDLACSCTLAISAEDRVLLMKEASIPLALRESTWSFISAMSGETTRVRPLKHRAGSW